MISKDKRSKFLQREIDEKRYSLCYNFIKEIKGLDSTVKLLLIEMSNDTYMNGEITWKQQTYADRLGLSRQQISKWIKKLIASKILIPDVNNKPGGKSNTYKLDVSPNLINSFIKNKKPVNPGKQTCKPGETQPVNPGKQTCKPEFTYNKNNKDNKSLLLEEDAFSATPSKGPTNPTDLKKPKSKISLEGLKTMDI